MASTGFESMFSIASAVIFEMKPTDLMAIAKTPGNAPRPTALTKISAQTISWTLRLITIKKRPNGYKIVLLGVTLAAPNHATGNEKKHPSTVPTVAIMKVSIVGTINSENRLKSIVR